MIQQKGEDQMRGKVIVFEGLDGVGKTTLAKAIGSRKGWIYYRTPPPAFFKECVGLDIRTQTEKRFYKFIECLLHSSREIKKIISQGINVAVDRWIWTTLSYHFAFDQKLQSHWKQNRPDLYPEVLKPDLSFLVSISDQSEWFHRLDKREELTLNDQIILGDQKKRGQIRQLFEQINPGFIKLDNSGSIDHALGQVNSLLN